MGKWRRGLGPGPGLAVAIAGILAGCAAVPGVPAPRDKDLAERWGIEVTSARLTAHGHMVDFRYRVLDAEKAAPLFERQTKPRLIHEGSGKVLAVPQPAKTGALRNSNTPQAGKIYWMFFGNAGKLVNPGDRVTVVIGDFRADHLVVE
jgi:hypothetical protein